MLPGILPPEWSATADPRAVLAVVPHAVVPQLLRTVVAALLPGDAIAVVTVAAARSSVTELTATMRTITTTAASFALQLPRLRSLDLSGCDLDSRLITTLSQSPTVADLWLQLPHGPVRGTLAPLSTMPSLRGLSIDSTYCSAAACHGIAGATKLTTLTLPGAGLDDAALEALLPLRNLTRLSVARCRAITSAGAKSIAQFRALTALDLTGCNRIDDSGFTEHLSLLTNLNELCLEFCHVTPDALFETTKGFRKLRCLGLMNCGHLRPAIDVSRLRSLEVLDLSNSDGITHVEHLSCLSRLRQLNAQRCPLDEATLQSIANLTALVKLEITHSAFGKRASDSGISNPFVTMCGTEPAGEAASTPSIHDSGVPKSAWSFLGKLTRLTFLDLTGCSYLDAAALRHLPRRLETLHVSMCPYVDCAAMNFVGALPELQVLSLSVCRSVDAAAVARLARLEHLEVLNLAGCSMINDAAVSLIAALHSLKELHLAGCTAITEAGIKQLIALRRLVELSLSKIVVSAAALRALSTLQSLEVLELDGSSVEADGLLALSAHPNLRLLSLHRTRLSGPCFAYIARLPKLKTLDIEEASFEMSDLAQLAASPSLESVDATTCAGVTWAGIEALPPCLRDVVFNSELA